MRRINILIFSVIVLILFQSVFSVASDSKVDSSSSDLIRIPGFDLTIQKPAVQVLGETSNANVKSMARSSAENVILDEDSTTETEVVQAVEESSYASEDAPKRKVIISLKNPESIKEWKQSIRDLDKAELNRLKSGMRQVAIDEIGEERVSHKYETINSFSAEITEEEYDKLLQNPLVDSIEDDDVVHESLADSTIIINSTRTNKLIVNNQNLTGYGQTICILDTGIDYTHESFGGCSAIYNESNVTSNISLLSPSYPINYTNTNSAIFIGNITVANADAMQIFFTDIDTENTFDFVLLYDKNSELVWWHTGSNTSIWSAVIPGDVIQVWLDVDNTVSGRGFNISQVKAVYHNSTCGKVIGGHDYANGDTDPMDDEGHGTHVAGIAAANGSIHGVAPGAKLIAMKVLDDAGSGYDSDILAAIDNCISNKDIWNVSVISMSLGSGQYSSPAACDAAKGSFKNIVDKAVAAGISVVAATGNTNGGLPNATLGVAAPACISTVIKVAASPKSDATLSTYAFRRATYNDILVAPGDLISSANLGGGSVTLSGTSMATPHVAGAIAILKQLLNLTQISKTPNEIMKILNNTGKIIYDSSTNKNYSRINIYNATSNITYVPITGITINSPLNNTYYNYTNISINITSSNEYTWFSYNNSANTTYTSSIYIIFNETNFTSPINFTVYVNNSVGERSNKTVTFWVDVTKPMPDFNVSNNTIYVGQPVTLDVRSSSDAHGITNYSWTFGDGSSSDKNNSEVFKKTYFIAGNYTVNLTVVDPSGNRNFTSLYVNVSNAVLNDSTNFNITHGNDSTVVNLSGSLLGYALANISADGNLSIQVIVVYGNASPDQAINATSQLETIVKYFEINLSNSSWNDESNSANVTFYIYNQTLNELGLTADQLTTYIYKDGSWQELSTTVVNSTSDPLVFSFTTDHFTLFSVGKEPDPVVDSGHHGGGGGGGGGGGASTFKKKCTVYWNCTDWGKCINGRRLRECEDLNKCNDTLSMPETLEYCSRFNSTSTKSDVIGGVINKTDNKNNSSSDLNKISGDAVTPVQDSNSVQTEKNTVNDMSGFISSPQARTLLITLVIIIVFILISILVHATYVANRIKKQKSAK